LELRKLYVNTTLNVHHILDCCFFKLLQHVIPNHQRITKIHRNHHMNRRATATYTTRQISSESAPVVPTIIPTAGIRMNELYRIKVAELPSRILSCG
jgi:hypothetical protein